MATTTTSAEPQAAADTAHASSTPTTKQTIRIGTRRSILARVQADEISRQLQHAWPGYNYEIHAMSTTGDNNQTTALHKFNEKALWTQELEVLLSAGELDLIVHCLKDMPTQLPPDLALGAIPARHDPHDALVMHPRLAGTHHSLADLPDGSVVGTSSLRRTAQMKRHHPHLRFADVRGNLGTRLAKLDAPDSEYSAIVLAVAGLERLGMGDRITTRLSSREGSMLYAVGQGALGIEIRKGDERAQELVARIACPRSAWRGLAERSLMRTLEGGCSVPIGIETEWVPKRGEGSGIGVKPAGDYHTLTGVATGAGKEDEGKEAGEELTDEMVMRAIVVSLDGSEAAEAELRRMVSSEADADQFGWEMAQALVAKGADKILKEITLNRNIIEKQGDA